MTKGSPDGRISDDGITPDGSTTVGFLHPGAMGSAMAAACRGRSMWASDGRSGVTARRASEAGMESVSTVAELAEAADVIVSICPPHAAIEIAEEVTANGFDGLYVDANAVSPATAKSVAARVHRYVDGSVIGLPPVEPDRTRLYLSGDDAPAVARLWQDSVLEPVVLDSGPVAASALKMAYASWTKGSAALLLSSLALADAEGVADDLVSEWNISQPGLAERATRTASGVGPKGWRFVGEMGQIADTMTASGLPGGFHQAAANLYDRLAELRGSEDPTLDVVLGLLARHQPGDEQSPDS